MAGAQQGLCVGAPLSWKAPSLFLPITITVCSVRDPWGSQNDTRVLCASLSHLRYRRNPEPPGTTLPRAVAEAAQHRVTGPGPR